MCGCDSAVCWPRAGQKGKGHKSRLSCFLNNTHNTLIHTGGTQSFLPLAKKKTAEPAPGESARNEPQVRAPHANMSTGAQRLWRLDARTCRSRARPPPELLANRARGHFGFASWAASGPAELHYWRRRRRTSFVAKCQAPKPTQTAAPTPTSMPMPMSTPTLAVIRSLDFLN